MVADRRKSFAASSDQSANPNKRRRAHSIAAPHSISPARRSIAPRKSILKGSSTNDGEDETTDYTVDLHDNTTQRSLFARRVSFAERAHIRIFKKAKKNSNSSTTPHADVVVTDENAYPRSAGNRRSSVRKSVAYSEGEASMEMDDDDDDAVGPSAYMFAKGGSALADDDQEEEDDDGEDMEMTEAISQNIIRKRSLSLNSQPRRPLSNVPHKPLSSPTATTNTNPSSEPDHSYTDDNSTSTSISTDGHPLEYTVPLFKSPAPPSDAWLKLRSVTHSGNTPYQPPPSDDEDEGGEEPMELTDAVQRLLVARRSLGSAEQEDSFASTNDSLMDDDDDEEGEGGDHTVNVTALVRRASMGTAASEAGDSTMEVTGDYGAGIVDQAGRLSVDPVHTHQPPSASKPRIFTPLSPSKLNNRSPGQHATVPQPFTFTLPPKSPSQSQTQAPVPPSKIPFPVFSAASPKKRSAPVDENQNVNGGIEPEDRPSPAKKLAVAGRWPDTSTPRAAAAAASTPKSSKTPSRLSPSKKAPFLAQQQQQTPTDAKKPVGSVRRPSGYLAQRKSLVPPPNDDEDIVAGQKKSKMAGTISAGNASTIRFGVATEKEIAQRDDEARARSRSPGRVSSPAPKISGAPSPTNEIGQDAVMQIVNPAAQWREDVQEQSFSSEEDGPHISIEQFFNMTGIRFMDEITAPRRSTIHPSALRPRRHSSPSSTSPADSDIPLAEYVTAMSIDVPQLELYTYVSKDLEAWIERSKGIFWEAEAEAEKITPELFREFVAAGEDGQAELLHQLKLIKANTHGNAKSEWYDWKLQWVGQLFGKAEKGFDDLTEDAKALEVITKQAQTLVPSLREEYDQIMRELEQEKILVAEIENSDQKYLNELKNTISEQNAELEAFRADVAEGNAKLERLEEKLQELDLQKREATDAIEKAQRLLHVQKNSTRAEVFRLKDELETLENLHLWHAVKVHPDFLEFIYASMYRVSIPCVKFKPLVQELNIKQLDHVTTKFKDPFPQLSDLMLRIAKQTVNRDGEKMSIRKVVERLSDYWSSCAQLRSQLKLVAIKYPLSVEITPPGQDDTSGFNAIVTIMFPNIKAKALVSFILDMDTFSSWPMSIGETKCEVEVSYGPIERDTIFNAVKGRLRQATPADNHACLLDACIEAMDQYA